MRAPFPYYGGKRRWDDTILQAFGPERKAVYVEPFVGSGAVLLANPLPYAREIVCDTSGYICNFHRALRAAPDETAYYADWPTIHHDLTARHRWLLRWGAENAERLSDDPDFYDAKAAGWWVWGMSLWIGGGWCLGKPTRLPGGIPAVGSKMGGKGVSAQRIDTGPGDTRPLVNHDWSGNGVSAQRINIPDSRQRSANRMGGYGVAAQKRGEGNPADHEPMSGQRLQTWFRALAKRWESVIILNRDFESALTDTLLQQVKSSSKPPVKVLLDPPYRTDRRSKFLYDSDFAGESDDVAERAYRWAVANADRPGFAVAYFCHEGDFPVPAGWTALTKSLNSPSSHSQGRRDMLLLSPGASENRLL